MIRSFRNRETESPFAGGQGKPAWNAFERVARRKLLMLQAAVKLHDLRSPPNNRLEALRGDRRGQHSIRINDQYRVCFEWRDEGAYLVEIVDYH